MHSTVRNVCVPGDLGSGPPIARRADQFDSNARIRRQDPRTPHRAKIKSQTPTREPPASSAVVRTEPR
ncbi:hypothetical protein B0H17DRAFT_1072724, partial [Mycena rosella]